MTLVSRKDLVDWFVGYEDILQLPEQPTGSPWLFDTADAARFQPLINNISSLYARIYERYKQACKRSGLEVDHSVFGFGYFDENSTKPIRFGSVYRLGSDEIIWPADTSDAWFARLLRNSYSHAATVVRYDITKDFLVVDLENVANGETNFKISVEISAYIRLIAKTFKTFVDKAVDLNMSITHTESQQWLALSKRLKKFRDRDLQNAREGLTDKKKSKSK